MIPISRNRRITYTDSWQFVDLQFVDKVGVPGEVGLRVEHLLLVGVESVHGDFWHFALELGFILASGKRAKEQRCACKGMIAFYFFLRLMLFIGIGFYMTRTHATDHSSLLSPITDARHRLSQFLAKKSRGLCLSVCPLTSRCSGASDWPLLLDEALSLVDCRQVGNLLRLHPRVPAVVRNLLLSTRHYGHKSN